MKKVSEYRALKRIFGRCQMEGCKKRSEVYVSFDLSGETTDGQTKCISKRYHFCQRCGCAFVGAVIISERMTDK